LLDLPAPIHALQKSEQASRQEQAAEKIDGLPAVATSKSDSEDAQATIGAAAHNTESEQVSQATDSVTGATR